MAYLVLFFFLIYFYFIVWIWSGLKKARSCSTTMYNPGNVKASTTFSIIIAAHNEEKNIGKTLAALIEQKYPKEKYEIIIVADRCNDETVRIVQKFTQSFPDLTLIEIKQVPEGIPPKKFALQMGIKKAKYAQLVLMDADCLPGADYLSILNHYFQNGYEVVVNIPKVKVGGKFVQQYILPERIVTWSIASASIGHQKPFLAFGGSWAYKKELLKKTGGLEELSRSLSGDDDLLIYRMGKLHSPMAICLIPEGWVKTGVPGSVKEFFIQRRRHHSAGRFYAFEIQVGYAFYHLSNLALWIIPFLYTPALLALISKFLMDAFVLNLSSRIFRENLYLKHYFLFEIGYLLQHVFIAPFGFIGKIRWR